ncbi:Uncharacterised protein [Burkholderia pseudomallei]|nr:Uncharacterised protein [Burkholderia pseudomallei]
MPPHMIRTKFDRPDAAGIRWPGRPDSVIDTSGMKKPAIAIPCTKVGAISDHSSTPVV